MAQPALAPTPRADRIHGLLRSRTAGAGNDLAFAGMIATRCACRGALPAWLGLKPATFHRLLARHFPGVDVHALPGIGDSRPEAQAPERLDELEEVTLLLLLHRAGDDPSEVWMARIVAAGCLGSDHLWQDLGLTERPELTALMRRNFPALAARNVRDMKWKRFLYKQLCEAEGIYTCRAPSCALCTDYDACFGPES